MSVMKGSCLCGSLKFEVSGDPIFQGFCQCMDCRKAATGSFPAMGFPPGAVKVTGEYRTYSKAGDSGKAIHRNFCPNCGGVAFDNIDVMPGVTIVNAALLEEPEQFKPDHVVYARSALPWDHMDPNLAKFPEMPPPSGSGA
jgi:hypothetical protein